MAATKKKIDDERMARHKALVLKKKDVSMFFTFVLIAVYIYV